MNDCRTQICELHLSALYKHVGNLAMRSIAMEPIAYPPLACPFPSAINPHATKAQQATIAWARRLRLLQSDTSGFRQSWTGCVMRKLCHENWINVLERSWGE